MAECETSDMVEGGVVIAEYENIVKQFLFPPKSNIPKQDYCQQNVLLSRTHFFSKSGKSLDPSLSFVTKTVIEAFAEHSNHEHTLRKSINYHSQKKISRAIYQDPSIVPTVKATPIASRPHTVRPAFKTNKNDNRLTKSLPLTKNHHMDTIASTKKQKTKKQQRTEDTSHHCICDCPQLEHLDVNKFSSFNQSKISRAQDKVKPFRAGKDPEGLISKRHFESMADDHKTSPEHKLHKGLCNGCVVPMKSCTLCNAYKTVYGNARYLHHRLQKKMSTRTSEGADHSQDHSGEKMSTHTSEGANHSQDHSGDSLYECSRTPSEAPADQGKTSSSYSKTPSPRNCSSRRTKDPPATMIEDQDISKDFGHLASLSNPNALFAHLPTSTPFVTHTSKKKNKNKKKEHGISFNQKHEKIEMNRRKSRDRGLDLHKLQLSSSDSDQENELLSGKRRGGGNDHEISKFTSTEGHVNHTGNNRSSYLDNADNGDSGRSYDGSRPSSPHTTRRGSRKIVRTVEAREKLSYSDESQRIHNRIKELMRKNESVLQYELSSSESSSDNEEECESYTDKLHHDGEGDLSSRRLKKRKAIPLSHVTPVEDSLFWNDVINGGDKNRREVFDTSLRNSYRKLYQDTLNSR